MVWFRTRVTRPRIADREHRSGNFKWESTGRGSGPPSGKTQKTQKTQTKTQTNTKKAQTKHTNKNKTHTQKT